MHPLIHGRYQRLRRHRCFAIVKRFRSYSESCGQLGPS